MNDGRKKKTQKHQNKTAFKIQFDPLAQEIHKKVSFKGYPSKDVDCVSGAQTNSNGKYSITSIRK